MLLYFVSTNTTGTRERHTYRRYLLLCPEEILIQFQNANNLNKEKERNIYIGVAINFNLIWSVCCLFY